MAPMGERCLIAEQTVDGVLEQAQPSGKIIRIHEW